MHYPPAHRFSFCSKRAARLPLTDAYGDRAVTLPLFATMTEQQHDWVPDAVRSALAGSAARGAA